MIDKEDFTSYLSIDNGNGLLLKKNDSYVLDKYGIRYNDLTDLSDLIMIVGNYLDDNYDLDCEDLEDVLSNLIETHYYNQVKK